MTKMDVADFDLDLENNLFDLHRSLLEKSYQHGAYKSFYVCDPKQRLISKAGVRDRVVHQALFRVLYDIFDRRFIHDSYSCRFNKGAHAGVGRLIDFCRRLSRNYSRPIYVLKCDVKKFFASIDKNILLGLVEKSISDVDTLGLIKVIVDSFESGLPLGNVTSQLFANTYLNELDQFIKHKLRVQYYLRYCDDFIILSTNADYLRKLVVKIDGFLSEKLRLKLHPNKISLKKLSQGIDWLGYVIRPHYIIVRAKTKQRIIKKLRLNLADFRAGRIDAKSLEQSWQSIWGVLSHAKGHKIELLLQRDLAGNIGDILFQFDDFEAHFEDEVEENHDGDVN